MECVAWIKYITGGFQKLYGMYIFLAVLELCGSAGNADFSKCKCKRDYMS